MKLARHSRRLTAWIAIFAILLAALAPSVARALSAKQKAMPWNQICSVVGTQAAPGTAPLSGSGQHDGMTHEHCPFCLNHAGHYALPPAALDALPVIDARTESFPYSFTTPFLRIIRAAAQPRAPPANS